MSRRVWATCGWVLLLLPGLAQSVNARVEIRVENVPRQSTCRYRKVVSGDGCGTLATKCGISGFDFERFNNRVPNLCATLQVDQIVCCSSGSPPDFRPKPDAAGNCAVHEVELGQWCSQIAARNSISVADIERFNRNTWGWRGCNSISPGDRICLSDGAVPMPATNPNAICGPTAPMVRAPKSTANLAMLNPCPLNACCNIWGNCGNNEDFCDASNTVNRCISNCGGPITDNREPPKQFVQAAYFEAWNHGRPCLHMNVTQVPKTFTHIHFAFADILPEFEVSVANVQDQFDQFVNVAGQKRIISIGGATSSADPSRARILRDTIKTANHERVTTNLANFVTKHSLDGIDVDYEFFEVAGLPSFTEDDGDDFVGFLRALRKKLPQKIIAVALPASYYHLRNIPVGHVAAVADYIVSMTYDLHGQWDYGTTFRCPGGSCLRSHVNATETHDALRLIVNAGVPANKVVVGVASYGRSYRLATPGCTGPQCPFTGPASGARPGRCTGTAGMLANAEIKEILATNPTARATWDGFVSDSNVLTYNGTEWVAFLDETNKRNRIARYQQGNFGGIADWAVDLESFVPGNL